MFGAGVCRSDARLDGKTVLITGANSGIGRETARDMARRGARVLLACRNPSSGNEAAADIRETTGNGNVEVYELDLASLASVRACAKRLLDREQRIDILINNAGVMHTPRNAKTADGFELQIGTNHLGHFLLTNLLLEKIKQSAPARIITLSSLTHQFAPCNILNDIMSVTCLDIWAIYGRSKLANMMFAYELSRRLKGTGVTSYSVHPGVIYSSLFRHMDGCGRCFFSMLNKINIFKTSQEGAQTSIYCAVQEGIEQHSGKYFSDCRVKRPCHRQAFDDKATEKLWDISVGLVGLELES